MSNYLLLYTDNETPSHYVQLVLAIKPSLKRQIKTNWIVSGCFLMAVFGTDIV